MEVTFILVVLFFYMLVQSVMIITLIIKIADKRSTLADKEEIGRMFEKFREDIKNDLIKELQKKNKQAD